MAFMITSSISAFGRPSSQPDDIAEANQLQYNDRHNVESKK